ncbi:uncharacterized protein (UPF0303 family) [Flavimobilis soli]|uniref:Uncharacterized protein (UPF0303 family) n=1 Tax=Flavimobilis soli TaxID=442709 RepID=A0A2A9ED98_9MICO|nr:heme-degrading domain-containing protein [Flavimobilis soli]PFG36199.1 uncharacterized protein (UPF0303 family) [Flavimobilis soli]
MTDYPKGPEEIAATISQIEAEMSELHLASFTADDARRLGLTLVRLAEERELPVAIDVSRGDHTLFHVAMPGATRDNADWIRRKTATVLRYAEPSLLVGLRPRLKGRRIEDDPWFDETAYAAHGGSFPVLVQSVGMVGTVTVSGLPQMDDHALVVEGLRLVIAQTRAHGRVGHAEDLR